MGRFIETGEADDPLVLRHGARISYGAKFFFYFKLSSGARERARVRKGGSRVCVCSCVQEKEANFRPQQGADHKKLSGQEFASVRRKKSKQKVA